MNYLDVQIKAAKDNYNYFFMKMISDIFKNFIILAFMLLLSSIFNYVIINIIVLIYTFYSMYNIYYIYRYYFNIISDIKDTLGYDEFSFEIDFSMININLFKDMVKYGK